MNLHIFEDKENLNKIKLLSSNNSNRIEFFAGQVFKIDVKNHSELYFRLSYSGNKVLFGYSDKRFGIDIEKVRKISGNNNKLLRKTLTKNEYDYLQFESNNFELDFLKFLSQKKAYFNYLEIDGSDYLNIIDTFNFQKDILCFVFDEYIVSIFSI